MQMVIAIPCSEELQVFGGAKEALLRDVCGVPLLVRVIATGVRAGANRALIIHREEICPEIEITLRKNKLLSGLRTVNFIKAPGFEAASPTSWRKISGFIEDEFLWLPWNWVTNKHSLTALSVVRARPQSWSHPLRLTRSAVLSCHQPKPLPNVSREGAAIASPDSVGTAERWLVAHSGKPLDGIYSKFNRRLCRPLVRLLARTAVTPNMVTFAGLLVGIVSAYSFSQGNYLASLLGALLFFLSGLLDEVDGMLARVRFSESAFGTWFEGSVDNLSYLLLFIGVTVGLYHQCGPQEVLLGGLTLLGAVLSISLISWQKGRLTHAKRPNEYCAKMYRLLEEDRGNWLSQTARRIEFLLKKGVFIHYVMLFAALGRLPALLRLAAFASNLTWILALYFSFRFLRRREPGAGVVQLSKAA
jgi:phosphatidylglycerophosphate synthase